ncbi:MAG: hypothetical protein PHV60_00755 [bacterium]|nr:hypothetical protein [bacterium]
MDTIKITISKIKGILNHEITFSRKQSEALIDLHKEFGAFATSFERSLRERNASLKFKVSSLFLQDSYEYLISSPNEVIHLVTGMELDHGVFVMNKLEKVKFSSNPVGAKADMADLLPKLTEIDERFGHLLLGVFHSHPFQGISGTQPSGTDKNLQKNLEASGYEAIQAIFSSDGYFRFFSNHLTFEIEIYGKGVEKIEGGKNHEEIYKLVNAQKRRL